MIAIDEALRPTWLFGAPVHERCDRAGYYEQGDFASEYGSPKCLVKLGCWGPVVKCNVPKRGWINGIRGRPNVRRDLIGGKFSGAPHNIVDLLELNPRSQCARNAARGCKPRIPRILRPAAAHTTAETP